MKNGEKSPLLKHHVEVNEGSDEGTDESSSSPNSVCKFQTSRTQRKLHFVAAVLMVLGGVIVWFMRCRGKQHAPLSIAFLGNSMIYFNDFPRFYEAISDVPVRQDSCLHGNYGIWDLIYYGNGMLPYFETNNSIMGVYHNSTIYDFGACSVRQILLGRDYLLDQPDFIREEVNTTDLFNPCLRIPEYREFEIGRYKERHPQWDYIFINDYTKNPARAKERKQGLVALTEFYIPILQQTKSIPVFLWTQAYSIPPDNSTAATNDTDVKETKEEMEGLEDVANFTSLTYVGLKAYVDLLEPYLPPAQKPRIAPVGLAFLAIYEENIDLWNRLFHSDHKHAAPLGTFLQGCVVHYTITGRLPPMPMSEQEMINLWSDARMMQHPTEPPNPYPNMDDAAFVYDVAKRITLGYIPKTFIHYQNGEAAL